MTQYTCVTIDYPDVERMMNPMRRICFRHCLAFLYAFLGFLSILFGVFFFRSGHFTPWGMVYPLIGLALLAVSWGFARRRKKTD